MSGSGQQIGASRKNQSTYQFLNLGIIQVNNIVLRNPIRKHQRVRPDRRAVPILLSHYLILATLAADKKVLGPRVVAPRGDTHAVASHPAHVDPRLDPAAAGGAVALGEDVPLGRDPADEDALLRDTAAAADFGVDGGALSLLFVSGIPRVIEAEVFWGVVLEDVVWGDALR